MLLVAHISGFHAAKQTLEFLEFLHVAFSDIVLDLNSLLEVLFAYTFLLTEAGSS